MTVKVRRRTEIPCGVCGRGRHRTCKSCGQTKLIGYSGKQGLYHHDTGQLHGCAGESVWESDAPGRDDSNAQSSNDSNGVEGTGGKTVYRSAIMETSRGDAGDGDGQGEANPLKGKRVAITGMLGSMTRNEAIGALAEAGAYHTTVVDSRTNILVVADSVGTNTSGKMQAASANGTEIMSEKKFMELLGDGQQGQGEGEQPEDDELINALVEVLKTKRKELMGFDPEALEHKLEDLAKEALETAKEQQVIKIEVVSPETKEVLAEIEGAHEQSAELIRMMQLRKGVMLVGPAGSGKTKGVELAAEALNLNFHPKSVGPTTTEGTLMGYMAAGGNYVPGILREPFEKGGVLLLDEVDSGNPACLTVLNSALANDYCSFPDQVVKKHPDFVAVASGNTYGRGADRQYVGRNQMDAATLDRFMILPWEYDTKLESGLINAKAKAHNNTEVLQWMKRVWELRRAVNETKERFIISTRKLLDGADMIIGGYTLDKTEQLCFWNGCDPEMKQRILSRVAVNNGRY